MTKNIGVFKRNILSLFANSKTTKSIKLGAKQTTAIRKNAKNAKIS